MQSTISDNNPVGRLYNILESMRRANHKDSTIRVWAAHFHFNGDDTETLYRVVAETRLLVRLAKEALTDAAGISDSRRAHMLTPFVAIEKAFEHMSLHHSWQSFCDHVSQEDMVSLKFAALEIQEMSLTTEIDAQALGAIRSRIDELREEIISTQMDVSLKSFLLENLAVMQRAILLYEIHGVDGLKHAFKFEFGSWALEGKQAQDKATTATAGRLYSLAATIVRDFAAVIKVAEWASHAIAIDPSLPKLLQ